MSEFGVDCPKCGQAVPRMELQNHLALHRAYERLAKYRQWMLDEIVKGLDTEGAE